MELDIREIKKIIPHRFPFLLIDKVIDVQPNQKLTAIKNVSINEQFFIGHFPQEKIMPGVLIVEAMPRRAASIFITAKIFTEKIASIIWPRSKQNFTHPLSPVIRSEL